MCDDLSFIDTTQQTLKPAKKKRFNFQDGWEKTSYPGISAKAYWREHEMQVASKKVYWKNKWMLQHIAVEKDIFQNLTDAFFKYL